MSDTNDLNDTDFATRAIVEARARADAAIADAEALRAGTVALRADLDEAHAMLRAIDDAVGGVREGESLVDAVRRVAREGVRSDEARMGDGMGHAHECVTPWRPVYAMGRDGDTDATAPAAESLSEPTARDAVAGMDRLTGRMQVLESSLIATRTALGASEGEGSEQAAKRAVAERDAAYLRGQEEMRERATAIVAKYTGYAAADVRSLPIAKTPAAPASEDAGEAVRRRATEAAGAGDSVAREIASAQDTCGEPNEDTRVHYGSVSWVPTCNESTGHNGDHVARGMSGVGAIRWARTCAREDATCDVQGNAQAEIARLRAEIDRVASALLLRDLEVAAWRDTTGCSTPEQVSERAARIRQAAELLRD